MKKVKDVVDAKDSRQNSTFEVLKLLKTRMKNNDLVGIHNAVNPFVTQDEIGKVYGAAKKWGASLLAYPAKDTVKIVGKDEFVAETPLREKCWYAQTPQVSTFKNLWKAHARAAGQNFVGTDDAQLLERIGVKVRIVPCSLQNFKITFPQDLLIAEQIVRKLRTSKVKH
ncbi:MAG: 2-C-methyl-D-erythritol 4-phosphate cytidylyltransferase [Candidatus Curtissbacteria bacterium GW2011_GWA1_40_47]|nr:MAG: 2-C-methyl-D-erythritol 4-phosphate cytidylyltransferase [Candidatus Curtissbacteria bacterium GW2011_GWA2_40_31]KKR64118.1 MAG: 2-C-methyl-D-erythritol 4-phosphate cytidylyltransferase [Candidatus Curtissbacteria bacterium GW2011_GWA1_40_47]